MAAANNKSPIHAAAANNSPAIENNSSTKEKMETGRGEEEENGFDMGVDGEVTERKKPIDIGLVVVTKLFAARDVLWNGKKKELIGRTWDSWAKIGLFYLVFYSCLALFFAIMMAGFFLTLDNRAPTQKGLYSLIKANPGMGFKPMPNVESTLIRFKQGVPKSYKHLTDDIDAFLKAYKDQAVAAGGGRNCSSLGANETLDDPKNEFCEFDLAELGTECTAENSYGYYENKPCILLKINRVYGWQPTAFTPSELADNTSILAQDAKTKLGDRFDPTYIGVTCEGENEGDADNLRGVTYYPNRGFSFKHYPYYNQPNYLPPLVFVQFDTPREGVLTQIWCRIWVSNIKHHKNDKAASTHFELLVD